MTQPGRFYRWLLRPLAVILLIAVVLTLPSYFVKPHDGAITSHFDGEKFHNVPRSHDVDKSLFDLLRWISSRDPGPWTQRKDVFFYTPPARVTENLRVTFVNHSTVLLQTGGLNILTDPVWSKRAGPLGLVGPRRFREPGIRFANLPPIDVVLISHNHYDHLDMPTIKRLAQEHDPIFIVPLANGRYLQKQGVDRVTEVDWWQTITVDDVAIHSVPARHWSRRTGYDHNVALWSGFYLETPIGGVYYAGDTGMGPHFEAIRSRLGSPRLALLPIGAYLPRWFMAPQHIDPAEAVAAHALLGARQSMAIHFGTFKLGDDGQNQPATDLGLALRAVDVPREAFWIPGHGESRVITAEDERLTQL